MVLEKLGDSLKGTLSKIASSVFVDDKLINELVKDIQRALLQADVNVKLVFDLTNSIKDRIKKDDTPAGLTKKEHLINIVYEQLVEFLGKEKYEVKIEKKPFNIMLLGLFGAGKTTTSGKLAKYYQKRGHKVALVGLDVHRPAAMDQISQIASQINVPVFIDKKEKSAVKIYQNFKDELKEFDVVIIDTAGRDALSDDLIKEIEDIHNEIRPDEKFLVLSADIGQAAQKQATQFNESCNVTGVIITKMDGTARGGGSLTACSIAKAPIVFIGVGEKVDDLEHFNPKGFVGRLLGMGDLEALLEKAKGAIKAEDAEDLGKRFLKGDFNLLDLYEQMSAMKKMGSLKKIVEMVPGFSSLKMPKEMLDVQEGKLDKWKIAMQSMTQHELENPEEIDTSRMDRISQGSGTQVSTIRELIKQYRQSKKMVKMFKGSKGDMSKMMKKFGGKMPAGFKM
ncbi:signal recognition particle protein [Candidatus Woesearchaeota archaeon]|nr:signal recognition particle protein [Candidatus Woesearchaeota archaeon]